MNIQQVFITGWPHRRRTKRDWSTSRPWTHARRAQTGATAGGRSECASARASGVVYTAARDEDQAGLAFEFTTVLERVQW